MNSVENNYYGAIGYLAYLTPLAALHVLALSDCDACLGQAAGEDISKHKFFIKTVKEDFFSACNSIRKSPFKALRNITIAFAAGVAKMYLQTNLKAGISQATEFFRLFNGLIQRDGIVCFVKHLAQQTGFTYSVLDAPLVEEIAYRYLFQDKFLNNKIVKKAFKYNKLSSFKQTCLRVTVASAIFALGHLNNGYHPTLRSLWPQFLGGILNGCLYESVGLIPSIAAHSGHSLICHFAEYIPTFFTIQK